MGVLTFAVGRDRAVAHLAFAIYLGLIVLVGLNHEPWFDEAQAWLIARDETPWTIMAHVVRYEGTPGLWHLVLWSLQRLGLPYGELWLVSATLAAGGSALILYRSPFPLWLRVGLIFGYFPAYQFAIVARSYALDMLLFPLIATLWPQRTARPLTYAFVLGLTANTNAYGFLLTLPLAAEFALALRRRLIALEPRAWGAATLYGGLALAVVWQAWPPKDLSFPAAIAGPEPARAVALFAQAMVDSIYPLSTAPPPAEVFAGVLVSLLIFIMLARLCIRARRGVLLFTGLAAALGFAVFKYGMLWHAGVLYLYLLTMAWIAWEARADLTRRTRLTLDGALAVLVAFGLCQTGAAAAHDLSGPSSSSTATARLIRKLQAETPDLRVAALGYGAFNVQPFFPRNLFVDYDGGAPRPAYYQWSRRQAYGANPSPPALTSLTTTLRPDLILISSVKASERRDAYVAQAKAQGYCLFAKLHGALLWKSYTLGDDDVEALRPCAAGPAR